MKKESILYTVIGLLTGVIITGFFATYAVNNSHSGMMGMMGMDTSKSQQRDATDHSTMSMADMSEELKNKSGDDFDKAFVEMMISHHQGAIDMAELIPTRAKHDEIKTLGKAIITAQTKEINDMKSWQTQWGYESSPGQSDDMMGH